MARGGKREGAGRKGMNGIAKTVSLTLTAEQWAEIEQSGLNVSAFVRELFAKNTEQGQAFNEICNINQTFEEYEKCNVNQKEQVEELTQAQVDVIWRETIKTEEHQDVILSEAYESLRKGLFPKGSDRTSLLNLKLRGRLRFVCVFTGKKYGSATNLVRASIPWLLNHCEYTREHRNKLIALRERDTQAKSSRTVMD